MTAQQKRKSEKVTDPQGTQVLEVLDRGFKRTEFVQENM